MNVIIIEDEKLAAVKLAKMIQKYDSEIQILDRIGSVKEAISWFQNHDKPDLAFMDIQLTDGTSFDILEEIEVDCPVIFTTAYDEYALQAFNLQSIDYLIKPISQKKLESAMQKMEKLRENLADSQPDFSKLLSILSKDSPAYKSRFLVKSGSVLKSIATIDIAYFYSGDKMVFLVTNSKQQFVINETLDVLENLLSPSDFFRINRQYIVRFPIITKVHTHFNGRLKVDLDPAPDDELYISNRRAAAFKEWMDK